MRSLRIPLGVWGWRGSALVLVLLLAPLLAALTIAPDGDVVSTASSARSLLVGSACLAAGLFLYLHWRITASDGTGWLALLLAATAVPGLSLGALSVTRPDIAAHQVSWLLVFRVAIVLALIAGLLVARRVPLRVDPLAAGLLVGLVVACARHVVLVVVPALPAFPAVAGLRIALLAALVCALAFTVSRLQAVPTWARGRLAAGVLLLGLGSAVGGLTALVTGLVGAVLLAGTAAAALHQAIDEEKQEVADLHERLQTVESGLREDRARLHEIDATVAGIASAQRILHEGLAADRRDALAAMVRAEVERLHRMVADRGPVRHRSVDLDEVVEQIVLAHLARGREVRWEPSGLRAIGRSDDIAEVLNVLLENAAVHGGDGPVRVSVDRGADGDGVTITVADRGPGVPPELRDRVFDWGVQRPGSPGHGIGLHTAADIAHELGGRLELLPTVRGAAFALHLPEAPREVTAREHVARAS